MAFSFALRPVAMFGQTRNIVQVLDDNAEIVYVAETRDQACAWVLSVYITQKLAEGFALEQAFDAVLGGGAYRKFAGEVYDSLRARVAA